MASAEDLGKKLLAEVDEVGLDEIFSLLRSQDCLSERHVFGFQPLDQLLRDVREARPSIPRITSTWPIVELMSSHPGGGTTHLLYHLCASAVLPSEYAGRQSCVIVLDADGTFSAPRLATHLRNYLHRSPDMASAIKSDDIILTALKQIHIFRPQSLATMAATLNSFPDYLFSQNQHHSFDRQVAFIAIDSASTFYWQDRAESEDAAFHLSTTPGSKTPAPPSGYVTLANALKSACKTFDCPAVFTARLLGSTSTQQEHRSYRSSFPAAFAALPTLRLIVQRVPIRRFPPNIGLDAALRETHDRQKALGEGKFVCFVNEWVLEERAVQKLNESAGGSAFSFKIVGEGVVVEEP